MLTLQVRRMQHIQLQLTRRKYIKIDFMLTLQVRRLQHIQLQLTRQKYIKYIKNRLYAHPVGQKTVAHPALVNKTKIYKIYKKQTLCSPCRIISPRSGHCLSLGCPIHMESNIISHNLLATQSAVSQISNQHVPSTGGSRNIFFFQKTLNVGVGFYHVHCMRKRH